MARESDELANRPERVIIVDAEDPMTEVHGRFVWQEEHERVVEEGRRGAAYLDGYHDGLAQSSTAPSGRRRRSPVGSLRVLLCALLALLVILMLPVIFL